LSLIPRAQSGRGSPEAFSSEVETGSRKENASKQEPGPFSVSIPSERKRLPALAEWPGREDIGHGFRNLLQTHRVFQLTYPMTDEDERELETELARLQQEHRDLDAAIDALHQSPAPDLLRLQRLKKRKLQLRDRIAFIEDQITPDIIA
jgi:hypothetical protein